MAPKRNPNDRNLVAEETRRASSAAPIKSEHVDLSTGVGLTIFTISYTEINTIVNSVQLPEVPTYETRTSRGRVEHYPLDAKVVEQSPEYADIWRKYRHDLGTALQEQGIRSTRAIFLDGTKPDEGWEDLEWERRMKILRIKLPIDPDELWLFYLETGLKPEEAAELVMKIMRLTTLPEEVIQAAEDTFRDSLRADDGRDDVENVGADQERVAAGQMA